MAAHGAPWVGATIIVRAKFCRDEDAAIVTRVHSHEAYTTQRVRYVNATVLPDMQLPRLCSQIAFYETREGALNHLKSFAGDLVGFWPDPLECEVAGTGRVRVQGTGGDPLSEDLNHGH